MAYERQIATVKRLLARYGEHNCVWAEYPTIEADTPWNSTTSTPTDHDVILAFFSRGGELHSLVSQMRGMDIVSGRAYALMGAQAFTPTLHSSVLRSNGSLMRPSAIDVLSPNGEIVMYTVEFHG